MQDAGRKTAMLEQISASHLLLETQLSTLTDEQMLQPGVNGEWSVKDMLAHITWWEQHLLRRLATGHDDVYRDGISVQAATEDANAAAFAVHRAQPLADVLHAFLASYAVVLRTLEALPEDVVAQAQISDAIAWDTFRHYQEHSDMLQTWMAHGALLGVHVHRHIEGA